MLAAQYCLTLWDAMDCSQPGSSVHGIIQARILELIAISFLQGNFPTQGTWVSCIAGRFFTIWATGEAQIFKKFGQQTGTVTELWDWPAFSSQGEKKIRKVVLSFCLS